MGGQSGMTGQDNGMQGSSATGAGTQSGTGTTTAPQPMKPPSEMNGSDAIRPGSPPPDLPPGKPVEQH
jgi:hypothetical protein